MSATLDIITNFTVTSQGSTVTGKQGEIADGFDDVFSITVTGNVHQIKMTLATATVVTVFDDDSSPVTDFVYAHIWADQDFYVQIIGSATHAVFKIAASQPFVIPGYDSILAAANTTIITGGSEPSVTDIDSVLLGNYSGTTMNYSVTFIQ